MLNFPSLASTWVAPTAFVEWSSLAQILTAIEEDRHAAQLSGVEWSTSAYSPTPTIIEAARQLRTGLKIEDIAKSEASEHEIGAVRHAIQWRIEESRQLSQHSICFLTGVPGSGKTLVGLSLAHLGDASESAIHFMSGNGPLVKVLQENFRRQGIHDGVLASDAGIQAKTLIENIHLFARTYIEAEDQRAPSNRVVIFDEAQRAWNIEQNMKKFKRPKSEPSMILEVMERHDDWAFVLALVGGGQEINTGEAGLEEWGRALIASGKKWTVYASPEVLNGGRSTAGRKLFTQETGLLEVREEPLLHLRTSNRSLRAEDLAEWVNAVLDGDAPRAAKLDISKRFPLLLTRSLNKTRAVLKREAIGSSRCGLVGSSKAARLRAEGLEPDSAFHSEYPWEHWYLSPRGDVRSSYQCEVFATEFEVQGLELDWVGVCWGGDFIWDGQRWNTRNFMPAKSKWQLITNRDREMFRRNAYRVLLTRARQGLVLFIPQGDDADPTRQCRDFDNSADFLLSAGAIRIEDKSK
ncbi:DUF2075 domain-containing protein [Terriglobus aquaticus]